MFEEAISLLSLCSSMNSWLTPTVLFLLLNLMIGTIFFTSGFTSHQQNQQQQPIFQQQQQHHHHQQQQQPFFQQHQQQQQLQPQLSRSNSVLQRLKSINFNNLYNTFYTSPPTTHYLQPTPPPPQPEPEPTPEVEGGGYDDAGEGEGEGPTLDEIYSLIKQGNKVSHYGRQNSDTKPSGGEIPVKLPQKMKKSASVKSAFNHFQFQPPQMNPDDSKKNGNVGVAVKKATPFKDEKDSAAVASIKEEREDEGVESVDAKADDFINKFKKQLQLQRNDSILRYKDMISRISAK